MKFTELLISIIVFLAIISFATNCSGEGSKPFAKLSKRLGITSNTS